ncbi:MAG: substrate-binding domain-containing protein [Bacillota bacterium]|nr:substrate-binding domain-containing protein [Bacillota bacterium]
MLSIQEIASRAGVTTELALDILRFQASPRIPAEERKRILEIANDLRYPIDPIVETKGNLSFALVHWYTEAQELDDPYYLSIRLGVERRCREEGIELNCFFRGGREIEELAQVDGIIAIGKFSPEQVWRLQAVTENVVFVDTSPDERKFDSVVVDFLSATESALQYLWDEGHRRIAYIGGREFVGSQNLAVGEKRELVYASFMQQKGVFHREDLYLGSFLMESGYQLMNEALSKETIPTAFFVASDSMAFGALRAAQERNFKVPEDISILSFNDIVAAEFSDPPLTTVRIHKQRMGEVAVGMAMERLRTSYFVPRKVSVSSKLIVRDSVCKTK